MRRSATASILASLWLTTATSAWAQSTPEEAARKLFDEGLAAEGAGDKARACEKFRASLQMQRELGPLEKVKDCDAKEGKILSAKLNLNELILRWPTPGPELDAMRKEVGRLDTRLGRLTFTVRKGAAAGIRLRLDGAEVPLPSTSLEVDPGKHEMLVDGPGGILEKTELVVGEGERKMVEVPRAKAEEPIKKVELPPPPPPATGLGGLGIGGLVIGGVGVLGFVGAGVTGGLVLSKKSDFDSCVETPGCSARGALADEGDTLLIANAVTWAVGIAGVGLGATLLIVDLASSPSGARVEASLGPGLSGVRVTF